MPAQNKILVTDHMKNKCTKSLKNNKVPGENNINSALLKIAGKDLLKIFHHFISSIWKFKNRE